MKINPFPLQGNWEKGWALDQNTFRQDAKENDLVLIKRTDIGEQLYQLKYFGDSKKIQALGDTAAFFIKQNILPLGISVILPVPPSKLDRSIQPVYKLAEYIGKKLNIAVDFDYLVKTKNTPQLLDIKEASKRKDILKDIFQVKNNCYKGKGVLLFDDLYSSGETLKAITEAIINKGEVGHVYVLTIAKTRVKR